MVDFPDPELPTKAHVLPFGAMNDTLSSTRAVGREG